MSLANFSLVLFYLCLCPSLFPLPNPFIFLKFHILLIFFFFSLANYPLVLLYLFPSLTINPLYISFIFHILFIFVFFSLENFPLGLFYFCPPPSKQLPPASSPLFIFKFSFTLINQKRPGRRYLPFGFVY